MPAGDEHQVVIVHVEGLDGDCGSQLVIDRVQVVAEFLGLLLPTGLLGIEAAFVDDRLDGAGCRDGDVDSSGLEALVGSDELVGPEAGGVLGAVLEGPVVCASDEEECFFHAVLRCGSSGFHFGCKL